ncbi:hypothetical protein [uncultured Roseibium sp.]|uniref:hypothetical protein n=1 Tax=uncultured Roseibium sp. TaxID=1936171 RepID=UPI00261C3C91|nr:hypothetical protein [uncultured Roseibium sp.]
MPVTSEEVPAYRQAVKAADTIRRFWMARQMIVSTEVIEAAPRDPGFAIEYGVRSDMVNGLPVVRVQRGAIR